MGCNFACKYSFFNEFWISYTYNVVSFFKKKFKILAQKMKELSRKNCFHNVYIDLTLITPLVKVEIASKFGETFFIYLLKDPKNVAQFLISIFWALLAGKRAWPINPSKK